MPRIFNEPYFFYETPSIVTRVQSFFVFNEDLKIYLPTKCCVDELGMYFIIGTGEGLSIDLVHAIEIRRRELPKVLDIITDDIICPENSFCIDYWSHNMERCSIFMTAPTSQISNAYIKALKSLINQPRLINPSLDVLIAREFYRLRGFLKCLDKTHVKHLFEAMQIGKTAKYLLNHLIESGLVCERDRTILCWNNLTLKKFINFMTDLLKVPMNLVLVNIKFPLGQSKVGFNNFKKFIDSSQSLGDILYKEEDACSIYYDVEESCQNLRKDLFSVNAFNKYFFSHHLSILPLDYGTGHQDMGLPISYYFINTSIIKFDKDYTKKIKTPLDLFRQILLSGCRSIIMECWEADDQLLVESNEKANTTLLEALKAIKQTAFIVSEYPIIISVEHNLSSALQYKMIDFFEDVFDQSLIFQHPEEHLFEPDTNILNPTPSNLRNKVILNIQNICEDIERQEFFPRININMTDNEDYFDLNNHKKTSPKIYKSLLDLSPTLKPHYPHRINNLNDGKKLPRLSRFYSMEPKNENSGDKNFIPPFSDKAAPIIVLNRTDIDVEISENKLEIDPFKNYNDNIDLSHNESYSDMFMLKPTTNMSKDRTEHGSSTQIHLHIIEEFSDSDSQQSVQYMSFHSCSDDDNAGSVSQLMTPNYNSYDRSPQIFESIQSQSSNVFNFISDPKSGLSTLLPSDHTTSEIEASIIQTETSDSYNISLMGTYLNVDDSNYLKISIFNERYFDRLLKSNPKRVTQNLVKTMAIVRPKITSLNSRNCNPKMHWDGGIQMSAMNFLQLDRGLQLNSTLFEINNRCGYVLKPNYLIRDKSYNCLNMTNPDRANRYLFTVKLHFGLFVANPRKRGLYCKLETMGSYVEMIKTKIYSKCNKDSSLPIICFDTEPTPFKADYNKEFNFLRFSVCDKKRLYGQRILNIKDIRRGFRYIALRNTSNQQLPLSSLIVEINVTQNKTPF